MKLCVASGFAIFAATVATTVAGDFAAALEADDVCAKGDTAKHGECALELAQLRASMLPSKKQVSLMQVDQIETGSNTEDQLNEEAAELAAKIHHAAEASAKLKQEASVLRAELQAFAERQAAAQRESAAAATQTLASSAQASPLASAQASPLASAQASPLASAQTSPLAASSVQSAISALKQETSDHAGVAEIAQTEASQEERAQELQLEAEKAEARAFEAQHFAERVQESQMLHQEHALMSAAEQRRLCMSERVLNFTQATVTHSNLGGMGPDDGPETIVYQDIGQNNGEIIDMIITAAGAYVPNDALKNGVHSDHFGNVNLKVNNQVNLTFRFTNRDGMPRPMDPFYLTFYDIDQGMSHESRESVSIWGFQQFKVAEDTELDVIPLGDDAATFQSTLRGGKVDNPKHPRFLTEVEEERTVVLTMPATSEFQVTLTESNYASVEQGRNFLFSGPSSSVCGREHLCIDYICPAGYHIRTMAEFLVCQGRRCEPKDRDTCCYEIPEGTTGYVPPSQRTTAEEEVDLVDVR
jgi:hypothetical protein